VVRRSRFFLAREIYSHEGAGGPVRAWVDGGSKAGRHHRRRRLGATDYCRNRCVNDSAGTRAHGRATSSPWAPRLVCCSSY